MLLRELDAPLSDIKGAGKKTIALLAKLEITDAASLLTHYPRDYEDRTMLTPLADYYKHKNIYTRVTVLSKNWFGFAAQRTLKVYVEDEGSRACLVCFGRSSYMDKKIEVGDTLTVYGHFYYKYGEIQSSAFELDGSGASGNSLLPVYPLTEGVSQTTLRHLIQSALAALADSIDDEIPPEIREREAYPQKKDALRAIHFPKNERDAEIARDSLIYEELFKLELILAKRSVARQKEKLAAKAAVKTARTLQDALCERLPFKLTAGQEAAIAEINGDIESGVPMERLLEGDVGSGKTLVSFMAALAVIEGGGQAALMAPTELLARQHAETAARLLEPLGVRVAFLTGNVKAKTRRNLLGALAAADIDLVVGTHALFSDDVLYPNLRLVVIDEQHRFGIEQRRAILRKGSIENKGLGEGPVSVVKPHLLMMSATPIPRTLALTMFGDWDVSIIRGMPGGRLPVETHLARESNADRVYEAVRKELRKGRQAYFVYPLIEKKDDDAQGAPQSLYDIGIADCSGAAEYLSTKVFPEFRIALLHSQLADEEKEATMYRFRKAEVDILVATSVVEVGVDVANATCMVIEHAERFGLSALHQLRGRVGRGADQSYCYLLYADNYTEEMRDRLLIMHKSNDGFAIAEEDLRLRGPGQILGIGQSGFMKLGLADPIRDHDLLQKAREDAFARVQT